MNTGHSRPFERVSELDTAIIGSTATSSPGLICFHASGHSPGYDGTTFETNGGPCSSLPYPCPPRPRTRQKRHSPST